MKNFTYKASRVFLKNTKLCFNTSMIDYVEYIDRMIVLKDVCSSHDPSYKYAEHICRLEERVIKIEWANEDSILENVDSPGVLEGSTKNDFVIENGKNDNKPTHMFFFPRNIAGLTNWKFNQYDADFHPSIPHGHQNQKLKLDPYQGWVYKNKENLRREKRSKIVELWNDEDFREFVSNEIEYYLDHNKAYNGWRVAKPKRLPRRR